MPTSEKTNEIAKAMIAAQKEMSNAVMNKTNPAFKSDYADFTSVREAVLHALLNNGITPSSYTDYYGDKFVLRTRLTHTSDQWYEDIKPIPEDAKPQILGGLLTYNRRYGLAGLCCVASEEDDDANAAQQAAIKKSGAVAATLGQETLPKAKSRSVYDALIKEMRAITKRDALTKWGLENSGRIYSMHDDFQRFFRDDYGNHLTAIVEGITEDGELIEQLRGSIEEDEREKANG